MKSTTPIADPQQMKPWKRTWLDAQKFCTGIGANLWNLTRAINEIFDDAEFRADNGLRDDLAAADWIDSHLLHIPLGYMELRIILQHYPNRVDWEKTKISKLRESIAQAVRVEKKPKPIKKRPTIESLSRERDYYASRAKHLASELEASAQTTPPLPPPIPKPRQADLEAAARACVRNDVQRLEYHARELLAVIDTIRFSGAELPHSAIDALTALYTATEAVLTEAGQLIA